GGKPLGGGVQYLGNIGPAVPLRQGEERGGQDRVIELIVIQGFVPGQPGDIQWLEIQRGVGQAQGGGNEGTALGDIGWRQTIVLLGGPLIGQVRKRRNVCRRLRGVGVKNRRIHLKV